uniref:Vacuolar protein sorting 55 n=1 Tax=Dunaliella tertiolecta TaxID=3047 RepID=A0A7S3VN99_DUNTE|mmetsp:Transcript_10179/g.27763  ORF Transcript_10179/g.27763 Transcript_10179/m.27763 type:complete len:127 (+) Transcript_10179:120-500(+)
MDNRVVFLLALLFSSGVLLHLLGCVLYGSWWPMLSAVLYVVVPMPYLFFSSNGDSYSLYGSYQSGWTDAGKFLTGFTAVAALAIPSVLAHAQVIKTGALVMELCAAALLGATVLVYDYFSSQDLSW